MRNLIIITSALILPACVPQKYSDCPNTRKGWQRPTDGRLGLTVISQVRIKADGTFLWNDQPVTRSELNEYLSMMRKMNPTPLTILSADSDASCSLVEEVRNEMDDRIGCEDGRCGEGEGWQ